MIVTNLNGTTDNSCRCSSWLLHWMLYSGQNLPHICSVQGCIKDVSVGAHVQKFDSRDRSWYIVPVCTEHNAQRGGILILMDGIALASANVSDTCGKSS